MRNQATGELILGNWEDAATGIRWEPMVYDDRFGNIRYRPSPHNDTYQDVIYRTHVMPGVNAWRTWPETDAANAAVTTATPADAWTADVLTADAWTADSITRILDELRDENHSYDTVRADSSPQHPDDVYSVAAIFPENINGIFGAGVPAETGQECVSLDPAELYGGAEGEDANG